MAAADILADHHRSSSVETAAAAPTRRKRSTDLELADAIERAHCTMFGEVLPASYPYIAEIRRRA